MSALADDMIEACMAAEAMDAADKIVNILGQLGTGRRVQLMNAVRMVIHKASPFWAEPVDCVIWEPSGDVVANDYNPNSVAPPEMELLKVSIMADGYTQPVVTMKDGDKRTVIDGFHRTRVAKESAEVRSRVLGYIPVVQIRESQEDRNNRIASTIRHNRARGKHRVDAMSDIVIELKRRNWTNEKICSELGMEPDEVLRLCQISGLSEMFSDQQFSASWDVEGEVSESDFEELTDDVAQYLSEVESVRVVNANDEGRIFHTYTKWECYQAGFYANTMPGMTKAQCEFAYRNFLSDSERFSAALEFVTTQWKHSCEHYLTNSAMNRIAWLGQAAACQALGIPAAFRSGFSLLTYDEQEKANGVALEYLNRWMRANERDELTMEQAYSGDRQSDIY